MKINYLKFFIACAQSEITMKAAVERAGLSAFVLGSIKRGKSVQAATAGKLAKALGVPVTDLLDLEN